MDRSKRIFRVLVSLLLVFALIVNVSPIRAQAVVPEATALGLGVIALLLFGFVGVPMIASGADDFVAVGNSFINYVSDWGSKNDKSEIVDLWIEGVNIDLTGGGGNSPLHIPPEIQLVVAQWIVDLLGGDTEIEVEGETAPEGYMYYNGVLLPVLPSKDGYPYQLILYDRSKSRYDLFLTQTEVTHIGTHWYNNQYLYKYHASSSSWVSDGGSKGMGSYHVSYFDGIFSNYDLLYREDSAVALAASEPVSFIGVAIEPDTLLGEVAPGIQEGTHTIDDIVLPEYVDTESSIKYKGLTGTAAVQQMIRDLSTQELTFEEYKAIVGSGPSSEPSDPDDGSDETQPVVPPNTDILDGLQGVQDGISQLPGQIGDSISDIMNQGQSDAQNTGQSGVDQIIDIIPDQSGDLMAALTSLTDVLSYEGTACVLPVPAIRIPALPGLFQEITVMEESELDLETFFQMIPEAFITIVRALFDIAVVGFCLKEFLGLLAGLANGFSKPVDHALGGDD